VGVVREARSTTLHLPSGAITLTPSSRSWFKNQLAHDEITGEAVGALDNDHADTVCLDARQPL
jgi:hypothetical protein